MSAGFDLDSRLAGDTLEVGRTRLSRVLLMNEARFPWLILVPERRGISELFDLPGAEAHQLLDESLLLARLMAAPAMRWTLATADAAAGAEPFTTAGATTITATGGVGAEPFVKLNVASLGNVVAQLHLHHVLRTPGDAAWPGPVWGHGARVPLERDRGDALLRAWTVQLAPLLAL